jgi:hypothetical protein
MKNPTKATIILGVSLFLVGPVAGCKDKIEESEKDEGGGVVLLEIGKPVKYWEYGLDSSMQTTRVTQFSLTFNSAFISKTVPWSKLQRQLGRYLLVYVRVENMGPREGNPFCQTEIKADNGHIYKVEWPAGWQLFGRIGTPVQSPFDDVRDWQPMDLRTSKAGEKAWWCFFSEIPQNCNPVELFGELGSENPVRFRLILPRDLKPSIYPIPLKE